jgi:hypothetical protein
MKLRAVNDMLGAVALGEIELRQADQNLRAGL